MAENLPAPPSPFHWRLQPETYRLIGSKCADCGHTTYPRRKICPICGSFNNNEHKLSRRGTVHTYCINYVLPPQIEPPAALAIVDLDGGGRYQGLITDVKSPEDVKIGAKVELVLRKILTDRGVDLYGYKFRLIEEG
ncbi:MAG: Zn-ribbon domain-containing OB-fold protein [Pseudomonadota bacterium]